MINVSLTYTTFDRFGNDNAALALNGGYNFIPSGVYLNTQEFSISLWVYPQKVSEWSRIIELSNKNALDLVVFALSYKNTMQPYFEIRTDRNTKLFTEKTNQTVFMNQWQLLVATFNGTNARIYLNETLLADMSASFSMPNVNRSQLFVGYSMWKDGESYSLIDDLRFYKKALTRIEIINLMNQNQEQLMFLHKIND